MCCDHTSAADGIYDQLSDHDAMIEAAGMVLLQAYNELGRSVVCATQLKGASVF